MSVSSLTTIGAARADARDEQGRELPARKPKRGEIGKVPADHPEASDDAKIADVLAKQIPTELIAPYTAFTAAVVGAVAKPTTKNPHPDQLATLRWVGFGVLVGSVIVMVLVGSNIKAKARTFPVAPIVAGIAAAILWAFLMPGSPLVPYLHSKNQTTFAPLIVALVAVPISTLTAWFLTMAPRRPAPRRAA